MRVVAKKSLGQNFLINPGVLAKVAAAAEINSGDVVLEIGPGTGNLTAVLGQKARRVIAIEKDRRLIEPLKAEFSGSPGVEIIEGDILKFRPEDLGLTAGNYKLVANIPYYLTSHLLRKVFEKWPAPGLIVLMVQKEVARRIVARPPDMNLLALSVQLFAEPKIFSLVSAGSFRPIPKVDSAIIRLTSLKNPLPAGKPQRILSVAGFGFRAKRKQLAGVLSEHLKVGRARIQEIFRLTGLKAEVRAENLSPNDWLQLVDNLDNRP